MSTYGIGVDIGGTGIKVGIVKDNGKIICKTSFPTAVQNGANEIIDELGCAIQKLVADSDIDERDILGVGVGCPGAISSASGIVDYANNLNWKNVHLGENLGAMLGKPIKVSNDANVAALGEAIFGVGRTYKDTIFITLGTGVGGGIVINRELYEGNESKGAEIGHTVIVVDGEPCTCGRRGCMEAYSSATALIRETKRAMEKDKNSLMWEFVGGDINAVDGRTSFESAKKGDKSAAEVVENYVKYLSEGMLNFANIFRPQAIILGGGVCAQGEYLIDKLRTYCKNQSWGYKGTPAFEVLVASLGNDAGIIGAAALIFAEAKR